MKQNINNWLDSETRKNEAEIQRLEFGRKLSKLMIFIVICGIIAGIIGALLSI